MICPNCKRELDMLIEKFSTAKGRSLECPHCGCGVTKTHDGQLSPMQPQPDDPRQGSGADPHAPEPSGPMGKP